MIKKTLIICCLFVSIFARAGEQKPNIVLITLDTFRADKLLAYGAKKDIAPALNQFAKDARVFTNSMTPSPLTLPAHATMLTGCFPEKTGLFDNGVGTLSPAVKTVAESLRENGYTTRAIVAASVLKARFGLSRGFEIYDDAIGSDDRRWGEEVTGPAFAFLTEKRTKPFFLWVHYYDVHAPYFSMQGEQPVINDYDKAVAYVDGQVRKLLQAMPPDTITIIASDHGESLGDHGEPTHGLLLYQPTTSVVIMVKGKGFDPGTAGEFRTLADIAPTILKSCGLAPAKMDGIPLDVDGKRSLPLSDLLPLNMYRWKPLFGATDGRYKWIKGENPRLFDLRKDPGETVDISALAPREAADLRKTIPAYRTALDAMKSGSFSGLGYLTGTPGDNVEIEKLPEPEKMLKVFSKIEEGRDLRQKKDWNGCAALMKDTIKMDPGNPALNFTLGDSLWRAGNSDEAMVYIERALATSPSLAPAWISKGNILAAKEKREEASKCFEKALSLDEDSIEAINSLAANYLDMDKPALAFPLLESAITRGIADAGTYVMQGRIHLFQKKFDQARNDFKLAMEAASDQKETRKAIADKYLLYGYKEIGIKYLTDGIAMYPDYAPNYLTLGAVYLSTENYRAALEVFEKALSLNLPPEDRKNVSDIVSDLRKGLDIKEVK